MPTTKPRGGKARSGPAREAAREQRQARATALNNRLTQFLEDLLERFEGDEDAVAAELAGLLAGRAYTEKYKGQNPLRILMQDPAATDVRGYVAWQEAGRQVRAYPGGEGGITIVKPVGRDKDKDAPAEPGADGDAPAEPAGKQPGEISSDDLKPKRTPFALDTVHDVRNTDPITCGADLGGGRLCGESIHRTGKETAEQAKARGPRCRPAATWTHTTVKPADGHKAVRLWTDPAEAAAPAA